MPSSLLYRAACFFCFSSDEMYCSKEGRIILEALWVSLVTQETSKAPKTNAFSTSYCICDLLLLWPCRWSLYRAKMWTWVTANVNWRCIWPSCFSLLALSPILHCEVSDLPAALLLAIWWPHYVIHNLCHYVLHIWLWAFLTWLAQA